MPGLSREGSDVFVFPSFGTYNRLPLKPEGDSVFSYKSVNVTDQEGKPFRIVFVDPKRRENIRSQ